MLINVIEREGTLETTKNQYKIYTGNHFIMPYKIGYFSLEGDMELISLFHPPQKDKTG